MWANFHKHYITEYAKLVTEGGGTTLDQERYGGAFHMADTLDNEASITESIVKICRESNASREQSFQLGATLSTIGSQQPNGSDAPTYSILRAKGGLLYATATQSNSSHHHSATNTATVWSTTHLPIIIRPQQT